MRFSIETEKEMPANNSAQQVTKDALKEAPGRALTMSTVAFAVCFAVWTIFSIIGIGIKDELSLSETQFGLLIGLPILVGSLARMPLGIWTDRKGGRLVFTLTMLAAALATFMLSFAETYQQVLIAAMGVGLAGGSFAVGVAYISRFFASEKQGTALGIFGIGNIGAAATGFIAPFIFTAFGWDAVAQIWAVLLAVMAGIFWFTTADDPVIRAQKAGEHRQRGSFLSELEPLKNVQVWRFAFYYFFVFGAFVALALWLPRYLIEVYGFDIKTAGMVAAIYSVPASLFRAYGGALSDRVGARTVMYWTFAVSTVALLVLSFPPTEYKVLTSNGPLAFHFEISPAIFIPTLFVLGFFMSLGKAAVYKHIPIYYPENVGAVGGLVGMIGGLGGFILPLAFGWMFETTGMWTSCFMLLFLIVVTSFAWMIAAVRNLERSQQLQPT